MPHRTVAPHDLVQRLAFVLLVALAGCSSDEQSGPDAATVDHGADRSTSDDVLAIDTARADIGPPDLLADASAEGGRPDGPGPTECDQIANRYVKVLAAAKACDPVVALPQCYKQVDDELACPCPTYVEESNQGPIGELDKWRTEWDSLGCSAGVSCPPNPCPDVAQGNCQPVGGTNNGTCQD